MQAQGTSAIALGASDLRAFDGAAPARLAALLADRGAARILEALERAGHGVRIIGGAVRNALIDRPVSDIDMATTARPEQVCALVETAGLRAVPTGLAHGTVTVVVAGRGYEVTTLRRDVETDGRHARVVFTDDFAVDALRRDFTINQLALSSDGLVHDCCHGTVDLAARRVRFIGEAEQRIREDYLRILRFFRFSAEYGNGTLDTAGLAACAAGRDGMVRVSRERIRAELLKLLAAPDAVIAARAMQTTQIWPLILPVAADVTALAALLAVPAVETDAIARLAALALRHEPDALALAEALRLSATERQRLVQAARLRPALAEALSRPAGPSAAGLPAEVAQVAAGPLDRVRQRLYPASTRSVHDAAASLAGALAHESAEMAPLWRATLGMVMPVSPFTGADALDCGLAPGPGVGKVLRAAEQLWAGQGFPEDPALQQRLLRQAAAAADRAPRA